MEATPDHEVFNALVSQLHAAGKLTDKSTHVTGSATKIRVWLDRGRRGRWMWVQIVTTVNDGGPLWLVYVLLRSWVVEDEIGVQSTSVLHFCQFCHRLLF